jgi:predicted porin
MKKRPVFGAMALCAAAPAMAQTSAVTLYGIVDVAVRTQTGLTASYARSPSDTRVVASGIGPTSRWGLRGSEDLGGGLRATFNVESGLNIDTGSNANSSTFFDRASTVGLAGSWGSVTIGRQNTIVSDSVGLVDPIGLRFASLNPNIQNVGLSGHQLAVEYGTTGSPNASNRVNNSIKYAVPVGPVTGRLMYSFGEVADSTARLNSAGIGVDYLAEQLSVTTAYTKFHDANGRTLDAANAGASWKASTSLRVMASYGYNKGATTATTETENRIIATGLNYAISPAVDLIAGFYKLDRSRTAQPDDGFKRLLAFVEHRMSRRSKVYVEIDTTRWKGNYLGAGNKATSNGISLGITHMF